MKSIDKAIRKRRKKRYKMLKKLFTCRDATSKYIPGIMTIKQLDKYYASRDVEILPVETIVFHILDYHQAIKGITILPPPRPVTAKK